MKTKYKYLILIIVTILASIFIYDYIEKNTMVTVKHDILVVQNDIENKILKDTNYTIDKPKVILNPYKISPLTALVIFKTNDLASTTVTVKGKDGDDDITNIFVPSKEHLITIYGLYPDYENTVIINSSSEEKVLKIKTDKLPDIITKSNVYESNSDNFYFTTSVDGYPTAYDKNGNVRWYLNKKYKWDFTRLSNGYILLGDYNLMREPYYSSSLVEMDLLGKIYYEYVIPGGYHHDVFEKIDGNLILLSNDFNGSTKEDLIVEIDRNTGEIVKSFDLSKLFKDNKDNWISLNSITYDGETNTIFAFGENKDMIINIDYNTGEINWIIADNDKIPSKYQKYLLTGNKNPEFPIKPQSITLTEGNFAYINSKDNENHLIVYNIDAYNKTFEEVSNYNLGVSGNNANIDYSDGSFVITQDNLIKKLENNDLSTIMEVNTNLYSSKSTKMYAGDMYVIGSGTRLGNTGITPTTADHNVIIHKNDKSVFKQYNLKFVRDANRLIVEGTFKNTDKVQVILDNVLSKKTYDVDVTNGKDTISGKKQTITYINRQGIYGKYYIYLKVNDVNYKLNKYVNMN